MVSEIVRLTWNIYRALALLPALEMLFGAHSGMAFRRLVAMPPGVVPVELPGCSRAGQSAAAERLIAPAASWELIQEALGSGENLPSVRQRTYGRRASP